MYKKFIKVPTKRTILSHLILEDLKLVVHMYISVQQNGPGKVVQLFSVHTLTAQIIPYLGMVHLPNSSY